MISTDARYRILVKAAGRVQIGNVHESDGD